MNLFLLSTLLAWICSLLLSLHYLCLGNLAKKAKNSEAENDERPSISIVITVHNQEKELRDNLPKILCQDYPAPFEVIVIDTNSEDGTEDYLEELEKSHVHLHHSSCPDTARDISISRLAITLGFRSACYEWVLLMAPDTTPQSEHWLDSFAQSCCEQIDAVQGFVRYGKTHGWNGIRCQFHRLWNQMMWMPWMMRFIPYKADASCLAYRKSLFLKHQGFASSFSLRYGAGILLVNHNIPQGRIALCLQPDSILEQEQPTSRIWKQQRMFYMETRRHMRHTFLYRLWYAFSILVHYLWMGLGFFTLLYFHPSEYIGYVMVGMWFISQIVSCTSWHLTAHRLGVRSSVLLLPILQSMIPLWHISAWIKWRTESKNSFRKKFV